MQISEQRSRHAFWARARDMARPLVCWTVWGAMTVAMIFFVRHYTRNVPYKDDMALVAVMTGVHPVNLEWLWSQHNEHRALFSRLILVGLTRFVQNDFRTGLYFNVVVLSVSAATMLLLARRLRGSYRVTDSVMPLWILNIGQTDNVTIAFALNLTLTAWLTYELIATASLAVRRPDWLLALRFGLCLVLLPLSGGSGLVMLPFLVLWLFGYVSWGWWSGREAGGVARALGLGLLMTCTAIVALYLSGYVKPAHHPAAPSLAAAVSTTLECLSMVAYPIHGAYWWPAGLLVALLTGATLVRLLAVGVRTPAERPRALALLAIILSVFGMAAAVGLSRSGLGPGNGRATRYITLMAPLLLALYIAWLVYGPALARRWIHAGLLVLACLTLPANTHYAREIGERVRVAQRKLQRNLKARVPGSRLVSQACPEIYPVTSIMYEHFMMLKAARFGPFKDFVDDQVAVAPQAPAALRR